MKYCGLTPTLYPHLSSYPKRTELHIQQHPACMHTYTKIIWAYTQAVGNGTYESSPRQLKSQTDSFFLSINNIMNKFDMCDISAVLAIIWQLAVDFSHDAKKHFIFLHTCLHLQAHPQHHLLSLVCTLTSFTHSSSTSLAPYPHFDPHFYQMKQMHTT